MSRKNLWLWQAFKYLIAGIPGSIVQNALIYYCVRKNDPTFYSESIVFVAAAVSHVINFLPLKWAFDDWNFKNIRTEIAKYAGRMFFPSVFLNTVIMYFLKENTSFDLNIFICGIGIPIKTLDQFATSFVITVFMFFVAKFFVFFKRVSTSKSRAS